MGCPPTIRRAPPPRDAVHAEGDIVIAPIVSYKFPTIYILLDIETVTLHAYPLPLLWQRVRVTGSRAGAEVSEIITFDSVDSRQQRFNSSFLCDLTGVVPLPVHGLWLWI